MKGENRLVRLLSRACINIILYIPQGIVYAVAQGLDYVKHVRFHANIACDYCKNQPIKIDNRWEQYFERHFLKLKQFFYFFLYPIVDVVLLATKNIFPRRVKRWGVAQCKALWKKRHYAEQNRSTIVLKYIIPISVALVLCFFWGITFIPEAYVILLASNWAGKILNFCSNILVRKGKSSEWVFLKACCLMILGQHSFEEFYQTYQVTLKNLTKELVLDLLIVGGLQRFSSFMNYCFQAFFGWLLLYILVKTAADETPVMLETLEKHLKEVTVEASQSPDFSYQLGNGLWVVLHYAFTQIGSASAQEYYRLRHQASHAASILLDCAETQGSNLNISQSSLKV